MAGHTITLETALLNDCDAPLLVVKRIQVRLKVSLPRDAAVDPERGERAAALVADKFDREVTRLADALSNSLQRTLKGWERKKPERVVKLVSDAQGLVRRTNAGIARHLKRLRPTLRQALALVAKVDKQQVGVSGQVRFGRIELRPELTAVRPPDVAEKLAQDLVDKLEIRSKWMFCSMAIVGRKAVLKLSLWKPLTKDQRMALRRTIKGTPKVYEGACKTSGVLLFRFVDRKGDLPKDLDVILKRVVSDAVGRTRKIEVGDPLPEVPLQLSKINRM